MASNRESLFEVQRDAENLHRIRHNPCESEKTCISFAISGQLSPLRPTGAAAVRKKYIFLEGTVYSVRGARTVGLRSTGKEKQRKE